MKIKAADFKNRRALEQHLQTATTPFDSSKDTIEGKRVEVERLGLNDKVTVLGIRVVITDSPSEKVKQNKRPERGEVKKGGILGR